MYFSCPLFSKATGGCAPPKEKLTMKEENTNFKKEMIPHRRRIKEVPRTILKESLKIGLGSKSRKQPIRKEGDSGFQGFLEGDFQGEKMKLMVIRCI